MNGLNLTFRNVGNDDQLGGLSTYFQKKFTLKPAKKLNAPRVRTTSGTGRNLGSTLPASGSKYYVPPPPPPPFRQTAGRSLASTLPPNADGTPLDVLNSVQSSRRLDTVTGLISQLFAGILPRATQQIAGQQVQVEPPPDHPGQIIPNYQNNPDGSPRLNSDGSPRAADRAGQGASNFVNSIVDFVSGNPLMVGGIALGAYLLMREPPIKRR